MRPTTELAQQFDALEARLTALLAAKKALHDHVRALSQENDALRAGLRQKEEKIKELEKKGREAEPNSRKSNKSPNLVAITTLDPTASNEVREKLDEYIREIDRCLAHLIER